MYNFDIKIIGGGVAGLACGIEAQRKGLHTFILDKDTLPKNKICGGLLTQKSVSLLDYLGLKRENYIIGMKDEVDLIIDKVEQRKIDIPYVLFCDRFNLSREMVNKYLELGGKIFTFDFENVKAKRTIYANGVDFEDYRKNPNHYALAIETKVENDSLKIEFRYDIKGYKWYFPNNTGIGGIATKTKDIRKELNDNWVKGALLPYGYPKLNKNLIGDRAGLCSPITGEGIYYAIKSGIDSANNKGHFGLWFRIKLEKVLADIFFSNKVFSKLLKNRGFCQWLVIKFL